MTPRRLVTFVVVVVVFLATATRSAAQDAHYWTLQYGPRSSLLGGAVLARTLRQRAAMPIDDDDEDEGEEVIE